ncbi:acetate--CoA ligase family protein [Sciscionella sediminilitoris]|uniref:acetate--CoA ligase family protein n=1 Tax=Sciscionella sediminilitoris TaxID=1445613 RepID=UPI00068E7026|nr:acetate--CoA ligase family protein [Sciscionella sp. SE31]
MTDAGSSGLRAFRDPGSLAVVGASGNPAKWGYWLATGALRGRHRRRVELVNRRGGELLGTRCAPDLRALDRPPELVALCVPPGEVAGVVEDGLAIGVRGFLGITAGVPGETRLAERIRAAGARLLGANSLGLYDAATELQLAWGAFTPGPLAIVSQSGQLGSELAILGARSGLGISRFVSIGNQSDVRAAELLADLAEHEPTRAVAVYLESFTGAEALFDSLATLRASGRPVLLLTIGAATASSRLARSHTGSLTSRLDVVDAACRRAGVIRVDTPAELVDTVRTLLTAPVPAGNRVAVVGDSGGQCGIAADQATATGLGVPAFPSGLAGELGAALPSGAATANPVDLAGAGEQDLGSYADTVERALRAESVDAAVLTGYFGRYTADVPELKAAEQAVAERLGALARRYGKPVLAHSMAEPVALEETLWQNGVPAFGEVRSAVRALAAAARCREPLPRAEIPLPEPVTGAVRGYWRARELVSAHGIPVPRARLVRTRAELRAAAERLRAPFVLKAGWFAHKSEAGAVAVGLPDAGAAAVEFERMYAALGAGDYVLEEQDRRPDVVELLIGVRREPGFGPVLTLGHGGTETELRADIAVELAPVSAETALAMLGRLRCAPLLDGWRGRPGVDRHAVARIASAVSRIGAANPRMTELELNPVRAAADGALAVDAVAEFTDSPEQQETRAEEPPCPHGH